MDIIEEIEFLSTNRDWVQKLGRSREQSEGFLLASFSWHFGAAFRFKEVLSRI